MALLSFVTLYLRIPTLCCSLFVSKKISLLFTLNEAALHIERIRAVERKNREFALICLIFTLCMELFLYSGKLLRWCSIRVVGSAFIIF